MQHTFLTLNKSRQRGLVFCTSGPHKWDEVRRLPRQAGGLKAKQVKARSVSSFLSYHFVDGADIGHT